MHRAATRHVVRHAALPELRERPAQREQGVQAAARLRHRGGHVDAGGEDVLVGRRPPEPAPGHRAGDRAHTPDIRQRHNDAVDVHRRLQGHGRRGQAAAAAGRTLRHIAHRPGHEAEDERDAEQSPEPAAGPPGIIPESQVHRAS